MSPLKIPFILGPPAAAQGRYLSSYLASHITQAAARETALRRLQEITPLQSEDVANAIVYAVTQPPHVNVNEILLRPTEQDR